MSFDTYREFEASLQAAREKRKKPNVNKNVLKKFILSTEAHNRNQEEQEMWMKHLASKKENRDSPSSVERPKKKKRKSRKKDPKYLKKRVDETSSSEESYVGPELDGFLKSKNTKWGHDGYQELYGDTNVSLQTEKWDKNDTMEGSRKSLKRNYQQHQKRRENEEISDDYKKKCRKTHGSNSSEDSFSDDESKARKKSRKTKKKKKKKEKFQWVEK